MGRTGGIPRILVTLAVGLATLSGAFMLGRLSTVDIPLLQESHAASAAATLGFERHALGGGFRFISPLLSCAPPLTPDVEGVPQARPGVRSLLESAHARGDISSGAVFVKDLERGPWFAVNESERFIPASLLKVPLMVTYLRLAESDPGILSHALHYDGSQASVAQSFLEVAALQPGLDYNVADLLERMVVTSDNAAMQLLLRARSVMPEDSLVGVYRSLGVPSPADMPLYELNILDYSTFFQVLYNSTYLSPEKSEYALELLSRSAFPLGIRAGVPEGVTVAHKFGERNLARTGERQLHDCGIVYEPGRPYLVCVMTRGADLDRMASVIADVSRLIHRHVREME